MVTKKENPTVTPFSQDLARIIKGLMSERGVTQVQIAKAVGKSQPYISAKVNGKDTWNVVELEAIAELLGFESLFKLFDTVHVRLNQ